MKSEFSTLDIVKKLNIPRERLRDWMSRGFVKPSQQAQGQGTKALFTRFDVHLVGIFRDLVDFGYKRSLAAHCIQEVEKNKYQKVNGRTNCCDHIL